MKVTKLFGVVGCCDLLGLNQSKCGGACPQPRSQHMPRRFDHHCISSGNTRAHWLRSNRNNRTLIKHHPSIRNRLRSRSARADINMAQHHLCLLFRRWNLRGLPGCCARRDERHRGHSQPCIAVVRHRTPPSPPVTSNIADHESN